MAQRRRGRRPRAVGEEQKEARRREILRAAKSVFAKQGYHSTTMADVAKAAKLSYGAVYWYFPSKEELFHAVMALEEEALRERIYEELAGAAPGDLIAGLTLAVRATFEFFQEDRAAARLFFRDAYSLGGRFESHLFGIYERFIDDIAALIAEAQRRDLIVEVPPRMAAFSLAALIGQLAHRRLTTDDGLDAAVVADFVVRLVMDGLRPR
ncbi:MAG TPA: TetR family transcriptional regulator [Acidimicrobiales bacterium]|nr:TetR family transcriptional regulator [Acidimicrobiales bacterium]